MKSLFVVIIFCMFFSSCENRQFTLLELPKETPIKGVDYSNEILMSYPWSIDIIENKLLLFSTKGEHFMRIIDANTGEEIKQIGVIGGGPKEFAQPEYWGEHDGHIYIYDTPKMTLKKYNWKNLLSSPELPETDGVSLKDGEKTVLYGEILKNGHMVSSVFSGMPQPVIVFDKDLNTIENLGNVPDKEHRSNVLHTYIGPLSTHENKFVFAMSSLGYIACYEQQHNKKSVLLWEHYLEKPIYKGNQLEIKRLKLAFPDIKMTKNYIFCSYFGERLTRDKLKTLKPRNLLVFDHQGNLLKNFRSERSLGKFTVSEDEKTIYAVTEEPEVAVIRFDISNLLK